MKVIKLCSTNIKACNWTLLKYAIPMAAIATAVLATEATRPLATVAAGTDAHLEPKGEFTHHFLCPASSGFFRNPRDCRTYCKWILPSIYVCLP
ncbi:hypothetical protein BCR41DRAFT_396093 [Lobosporangium transversale]|uniref:Uncharacterized protein n=1 Tax=Lobosporangium transversale TaxID=64571 RepID=A0A1Y2GT52_9FUNG|nr:hypothetical protein BCR41DRAFT_396093 [Lobosporangium transversale]ORZ16825.1 hypothetical protein BCR41DRAFT_396093 [Lobosporangium transversale]|eukprot:XP_021881760.1 hypothetical protein BCR41DRAFT_396093 [Lobosporangium transversale]